MASHEHPYNLASTCLRLRSDVSVEALTMDEGFWERLASGELGTFHNEYLVTCQAFDGDWSSWEMHPSGDEIVCLLEGAVTFVLEEGGGTRQVELSESGAFVIIPKRTWHTARVSAPSRMLFITAGEGTQHRAAE